MSFCEELMNPIDINNDRVLDILEKARKLIEDGVYESYKLNAASEDAERWVNREYLDYIIDLGKKHDGFPVSSKSYNMGNEPATRVKKQEHYERVQNLKTELIAELGVRYNALFSIYPPGGYISWHNNQNAPGYNVLLTWSENGDGYWEHLDPVTNEVVRIDDVPGWQCKYGYYGSYIEGKEKVLYHAAATNCWRMTIAFVFNAEEGGKQMSEMMVEDLQSNF